MLYATLLKKNKKQDKNKNSRDTTTTQLLCSISGDQSSKKIIHSHNLSLLV
jgi:hypothetical protein